MKTRRCHFVLADGQNTGIYIKLYVGGNVEKWASQTERGWWECADSFSREDQTELLKLCMSCDPGKAREGTGEGGPSPVRSGLDWEAAWGPTKRGIGEEKYGTH